MSASAVHIERKRLLALADGAVADAAGAVDVGAHYGRGAAGTPGVPLTDASVRAAVHDHLARLSGERAATAWGGPA